VATEALRDTQGQKLGMEFQNQADATTDTTTSQETTSKFKTLAQEVEQDEDEFGLDHFATKIHLGKPSGFIHDMELKEIRNKLDKLSDSRNEAKILEYLRRLLKSHATTLEKWETKGRLLWDILRTYGTRLTPEALSNRIWCGRKVLEVWAHGERAGYLWGVMIDALNKGDVVETCDLLWADVIVEMERRPAEFEQDKPFLWTVRMAGALDGFAYHRIEGALEELAACAGFDAAAWAFTRCLTKSLMTHQPAIAKLPNWQGKPLPIPVRAAHIAPLLADAGCVETARSLWIQDHSQLYSSEPSSIPESFQEARMEMEHLRAGLIVFARFPHLDHPHDTILAIILDRFEHILDCYPELCVHNHGLLYALSRSDFYHVAYRLAQTFLYRGSPPTIIASAMIPMCIRNLDHDGYNYWSRIRSPDDLKHFTLRDRYNRWVLKAATHPIAELLEYGLPKGSMVPLGIIAAANSIIRRRYDLFLNAKTNPHVETPSPDSHPTNSIAYMLAPSVTMPNPSGTILPINHAEEQIWYRWVLSMGKNKRVGLQDLHSMQKFTLALTVPGRFKEAEQLIFGLFRERPKSQDMAVAFLLSIYIEQHLYPEMVSFAKRLKKLCHDPRMPPDRVIGAQRVFGFFRRLEELQAPPYYILGLWNEIKSPNLISNLLPILVRACLAYGDISQGEGLSHILFKAGWFRIQPSAIPAAKDLRNWLQRHRRHETALGLNNWITDTTMQHTRRDEMISAAASGEHNKATASESVKS
jgi:hypothetical protein